MEHPASDPGSNVMAMSVLRFSVVLEWDGDGGVYVAVVPALGISTYGETREEALAMSREAILVTVEGLKEVGQPIPEGDGGVVEVVEVAV